MTIRWSSILALPLALAALSQSAVAQGHGNAKGHDKDKDRGNAHANVHAQSNAHVPVLPPQARGNPQGNQGDDRGHGQANARGHVDDRDRFQVHEDDGGAKATARQQVVSGGDVTIARRRVVFVRPLRVTLVRPTVRQYVISARPRERIAGSALAYAYARGIPDNTLLLVPVGSRVAVRNRTGVTLLDLDDNSANRIGAFRVVPVATDVRGNAPAFCRSGAGHPVWGRQWCIDKGFGLGYANNVRWGRIVEPQTVLLQPTSTSANLTTVLAASILRSVLGATTFDRLALHALTLGYSEPLYGRWVGETTGPRTMLVSSGTYPVAEAVDVNRDGKADNMLVALRPW